MVALWQGEPISRPAGSSQAPETSYSSLSLRPENALCPLSHVTVTTATVGIAPAEEAKLKDCYNILSLGLLPATMFEFNAWELAQSWNPRQVGGEGTLKLNCLPGCEGERHTAPLPKATTKD